MAKKKKKNPRRVQASKNAWAVRFDKAAKKRRSKLTKVVYYK